MGTRFVAVAVVLPVGDLAVGEGRIVEAWVADRESPVEVGQADVQDLDFLAYRFPIQTNLLVVEILSFPPSPQNELCWNRCPASSTILAGNQSVGPCINKLIGWLA